MTTPRTTIDSLLAQPRDQVDGKAYFYDWFCKDEALPAKAKSLITKLASITPSFRFDARTTYTFFKNNCPGHGRLYDDFRICDAETGEVVFCVVPSCGHNATSGDAEVWGKDPKGGEFKTLVRGSWKDVKAFFTSKDEAAWEAYRSANVKVSPFQVGVLVRVIGEYLSYGETASPKAISKVADDGRFQLEGDEWRWFKRDGSEVDRRSLRGRKNGRTRSVQLWSEYEASQKAEDDRRARSRQIGVLKNQVDRDLHLLSHDSDADSLARWTALAATVSVMVDPLRPKKVA